MVFIFHALSLSIVRILFILDSGLPFLCTYLLGRARETEKPNRKIKDRTEPKLKMGDFPKTEPNQKPKSKASGIRSEKISLKFLSKIAWRRIKCLTIVNQVYIIFELKWLRSEKKYKLTTRYHFEVILGPDWLWINWEIFFFNFRCKQFILTKTFLTSFSD